jgi:hypothetical protein
MADELKSGSIGAVGGLAVAALLNWTGAVDLNDDQSISYNGGHLLAPDYTAIYANNGKQIDLKAGQRYIQISMVLNKKKVIQAFADTLDTDIDIGILGKFTQCRR